MERTSDTGSMDLASWLELLGGFPDLAAITIDHAEQGLLLDLARIAAHRSVRIAAPITTFMAGLAYRSIPPDERVARLRALVDALDVLATPS